MINFECDGCGKSFSVDDERAGKRGKCPKCGVYFTVPDIDCDSPLFEDDIACNTGIKPLDEKVDAFTKLHEEKVIRSSVHRIGKVTALRIELKQGQFLHRCQTITIFPMTEKLEPNFNDDYSFSDGQTILVLSRIGKATEVSELFTVLQFAGLLFHSKLEIDDEYLISASRYFPKIEATTQEEFNETLLEIGYVADRLEEALFNDDVN